MIAGKTRAFNFTAARRWTCAARTQGSVCAAGGPADAGEHELKAEECARGEAVVERWSSGTNGNGRVRRNASPAMRLMSDSAPLAGVDTIQQ